MDALGGIRYGAQIAQAARSHGLDPKLLAAVAAQETGGPGASSGNNIVGDGGHGHGVFQIDDRTWSFAATPAAMDPAKNADAAASILQDDLGRYGGNVKAALSAYNSGSPTDAGTTTTWGDGQTLGYADSVMRHYAALGGDPSALVADNRDAATGVNALATLGAALPAAATATGAGASTSAGSSAAYDPYAALAPPVVQVDSQSPFSAPVSWANEMSANGPAGGKEAADADSLVANSIDASDDVFDTRDDA
jgi:hypothetical protein